MNYDVLIKAHTSDYSKVRLCVESLCYLDPVPENIYIVSSTGKVFNGTSFDSKIICMSDDEVTPYVDKKQIMHRPNWVWSSLITLFQDFTKNDLYLEVQADNFFIKNINLFSNKKPIIYTTTTNPNNNMEHEPYFNFSRKLFDIKKEVMERSFITEFLMFNKIHTKELIEKYPSFDEMLIKMYKNIDSNSYPSNQELFGNFIEKNHKDYYVFKHDTKLILSGIESLERISEEFLLDFIQRSGYTDAVACSYHSWSVEK